MTLLQHRELRVRLRTDVDPLLVDGFEQHELHMPEVRLDPGVRSVDGGGVAAMREVLALLHLPASPTRRDRKTTARARWIRTSGGAPECRASRSSEPEPSSTTTASVAVSASPATRADYGLTTVDVLPKRRVKETGRGRNLPRPGRCMTRPRCPAWDHFEPRAVVRRRDIAAPDLRLGETMTTAEAQTPSEDPRRRKPRSR